MAMTEIPIYTTGYCFYNGGFDSDGFDTFLNEFKEASENHDVIEVFLETAGGDVNIAYSLATLFKTCNARIVINIATECSSSGFVLLALVKDYCTLNISPTAWATVHLADISTTFKENYKDKDFHNFLGNKLELVNKHLYAVFENLNFSEKELADIKKFKDVFLTSSDLYRIFNCNNA